jgi:hypothetical protein
MAFLGVSSCVWAQGTGPATLPDTAANLSQAEIPDAPAPQIKLALAAEPQSGQAQNAQQPAAPAQNASGQSSSTQQPAAAGDPPAAGGTGGNGAVMRNCSALQSSSQQPCDKQSQHEKAAEEVREQEKQRVLGIAPNFNLTYRHDAVSLTAMQKLNLAYRSSVDPFTFAAAFMVAGYHEALDEDSGFGWGAEGYFKRSGAAYLDAVDGDMIGNGFLPALLHQDPRYFRLGPGPTIKRRILYSAMTNFVCKGDNGHWQPNISNVGGNIIAGALSNLYYPSQNSGWGQTIGNGMIVTTEGAIGSLFDEFWPDISRRFLHKDPTHGLDAQQAADHKSGTGSDKPIQ